MKLDNFENLYANESPQQCQAFPYIYPTDNHLTHAALNTPPEELPFEISFEALYEDRDRRRRGKPRDENTSTQVNSRRRAQNRVSQRAFRERKEKHIKELEARLGDLEGRHSNLFQSYEILQVDCSNYKQQVSRLTDENERLRKQLGIPPSPRSASPHEDESERFAIDKSISYLENLAAKGMKDGADESGFVVSKEFDDRGREFVALTFSILGRRGGR